MVKPLAELVAGSSFRGLRVHSLLGRGGMGAAYLASHPVLKTPLIIKTFVPTGSDLFREAHLAARAKSRNIVEVLDAGVDHDIPFVVQRYVDGIDLAELADRFRSMGRRLPPTLVAGLLADVAYGLHEIHQAGVIHRDIKLANVFLSGAGHALVGDFGIASDTAAPRTNEIAGTPLFMAPEIWLGHAFDHRADIYSLGAVGHVLLTGQPPFVTHTPDDLVRAHVGTPYVPPRDQDPVASYLLSLGARMLGKTPSERPETALEVARLLDRMRNPVPRIALKEPDTASIGDIELALAHCDITAIEADVLVNAANPWLVMDAGVALAMQRSGGNEIQIEAMKHGPVSMGDVVWTSAGKLRARWIAHAVSALSGAVCIQRCVLRVLVEAERRRAKSVAFPALGAGIGSVPVSLASKLMFEAITTFARLEPIHVRRVTIALLDEASHLRWRAGLSMQ